MNDEPYILTKQPEGDPSKVHLVMIAGADNRGWCIERTLPRLKPWFDTITVTDIGSTDNTKQVCLDNGVQYIQGPTDRPLPLCHEEALDMIPTNEWVYLCDSDECPSHPLLSELERLIKTANQVGLVKYKLPIIGHWFNADGDLVGENLPDILKGDLRKLCMDSMAWGAYRLCKKGPDFQIIRSDTHYQFNTSGPEMFMPLGWNHYKGDRSRAKSEFILTLAYPDAHHFTGPEADDWKAIQNRYGVELHDLATWSSAHSAPYEITSLIAEWKESKNLYAGRIYNHVFKYNWNGTEPACDCPCCYYP